MIKLTLWEETRHCQDGIVGSDVRACNVITGRNARDYPGLSDSGFFGRTQTKGPELELVTEYVHAQLPNAPRGQCRTIFFEPEIESSFPDVVAVYWQVASAMRWSAARRCLKKIDVRVAHFLAMTGVNRLEDLKPFFTSNILKSLERLCEAGVVRSTAKSWRLRAIDDIFAVRRLVAIEAKMQNWRGGLEQAFQNTWFSSESYVLLPQLPKTVNLLERARELGVGVRTRNQMLDCSLDTARRDRIPKSYASWLFNEWAWRAGMRE